mmetsp:Transcript_7338/g.10703  ORF Transcript_7338/g.10703 Transcript_7338/m.10703 type:complete len:160 (+) Transcript_7338:18-497(+)
MNVSTMTIVVVAISMICISAHLRPSQAFTIVPSLQIKAKAAPASLPLPLPLPLPSHSQSPVILHAFFQKKPSPQNDSDKDVVSRDISKKRRDQLGISDNEREYDLDLALERNTDPLITKIIAGSFILVVMALLVAGIVVPSLTDYGEGVCNPITTGGRC